MSSNAILVIENAELEAKKALTNADINASQIVNKAQKEGDALYTEIVRKAEGEAHNIISKAKQSARMTQKTQMQSMGQEKDDIQNTALRKEMQAIENVLEFLLTT